MGEPVQPVQSEAGFGVGPAGGQVQDPAASYRGELVAVPDQSDPGPGLVSDGQEGSGAVLVEHPRFVDQQQVTGRQYRGRLRARAAVPGVRVGVADPQP